MLGKEIIVVTWNKLIKKNIYSKVLFPDIHIGAEDIVQTIQISYYAKSALVSIIFAYIFSKNCG